jgi:hypothetical protein
MSGSALTASLAAAAGLDLIECGSVLVPVALVGGVTVVVVQVVGVVAVGDGLMTAALGVGVVVRFVGDVILQDTFVPVAVVISVDVAVMEVIRVIAVVQGDVPTVGAVDVVMARVGLMARGSHGCSSSEVELAGS